MTNHKAPESRPAGPTSLVRCHPDSPLLIVEDNDADFTAITRFLRRRGVTSSIIRCTSGDEALDYLLPLSSQDAMERLAPRLILLDLNLPGVDGQVVLTTIKSSSGLRSIPVLVLSSSQLPDDIHAAYLAGANTYAIKPGATADYERLIASVTDYWLGNMAAPPHLV